MAGTMLIVALALASGVISGLHCHAGADLLLIPGVAFAVAVIVASFVRYGKVGILRVLIVAATSMGANYLAVHFAIALWDTFGHNDIVCGAGAGLLGGPILGFGLGVAVRLRAIGRAVLSFGLTVGLLGAGFFLIPHLA